VKETSSTTCVWLEWQQCRHERCVCSVPCV